MKQRTGYLFQKRPAGTWYVRTVIDGRAIVKSTSTRNFRQAKARRQEIMEPYIAGDKAAVLKATVAKLREAEATAEALANPPPEIAHVWPRFEASHSRPDSGESTMKQYLAEWTRFARWLAAAAPEVETLAEVTAKHAEGYAGDLAAAKLSASTFNQHRNLLRLVWRTLLPEAVNPWNIIRPRKLAALASRKRALTPGQFEALLAATEGDADLHDLLLLLAWTGQRLVDGVKLRWSAVDFKRAVVTLAPQKTSRRTGKEVHIPLFPATRAMLDARQAGKVLNPAGYVFPALAEDYDRDASALSKRIRVAFEKAGMVTTEARADRGRPVVTYGAHSLRHVFITAAAAAGMPAAVVKSITGHATDGMFEHYLHLGADLAAEIAARLGNGTATALLPAPAENMPAGLRARLEAILAALDGGKVEAARDALAGLIKEVTA